MKSNVTTNENVNVNVNVNANVNLNQQNEVDYYKLREAEEQAKKKAEMDLLWKSLEEEK